MKKEVKILNEEDLIIKVIQPFFDSLGINPDEIEREHSFKVKLGRGEHQKVQPETIRGRADYLIKRGNQNLFIVEVKTDKVKISHDDIGQGVSYARLVHPIAPFVIITNGKETRVIDTITKEEYPQDETDIGDKSEFWKHGCKLASTAAELELRYEGLKDFVGYSVGNLREFSRYQVDSRMRTLKGSRSKPRKKYIPELFVGRKEIEEHFQNFLQSSSQCLALVGEAGVGKTNVICGLAEESIGKHLVLFFNCADLSEEIIKSIRQDFNWFFSPQLEPPEIIERLDGLGERDDRKVILFFDAIDEAPINLFLQNLNEFIRRLEPFPIFKICLTCKTNEWERFINNKGNTTWIAETTYDPEKERRHEQDSSEIKSPSGIKIQRFSEEEKNLLETKYRDVFRFKGSIEGRLRDECGLGFTLRIVAEIYENKPLPSSIEDDVVLIEKFLEKQLEKLDAPEKCERILEEIGKVIFVAESERKRNVIRGGQIDRSFLYKQLGLSSTEEIPKGLFAYNILHSIKTSEGFVVGFYFEKVRDYVIAIHSLKLLSREDETLKELIPLFFKGSIGESVLRWYTRIAKDEHIEIINQERALLFIEEYKRILDNHFPEIKDRFRPETSGDIGLVMTNPSLGHIWYGQRPLNNEDDRKLWLFSL